MINIAICDDEKNIRDYIGTLIDKQKYDARVNKYASTDEAIADINDIDIIFLDIEMGDEDKIGKGMRAAQLICEMTGVNPVIIFVTGHERFVYDAFDVGALQYLIKPIDESKFYEILNKAVKIIKEKRKSNDKKLWIEHASTRSSVSIDQIVYIESQGHKVVVHTTDEKLDYYAKISDLEKRLGDGFFRVHKGYLVNLSHVDAYTKNEITVSNGDKLLISRYRYEGFTKAHMRHLKGTGYDRSGV